MELTADQAAAALAAELPERVVPDLAVAEMIERKEEMEVSADDLAALGLAAPAPAAEPVGPIEPVNTRVLNAAVSAAVNAVVNASAGTSTTPARLNAAAVNAAVNAAMAATRDVPLDEVSVAPTANTGPAQNLVFSPAINAPAAAVNSGPELEEANLDEMPEGEPVNSAPMPMQMPAQTQNAQVNSQVNVQTSTQPVLVVPLNVGAAPPAAEFMNSPAPGAPPTFAVDTSERAMNASGLSGGGGTPRRAGGSRSASPKRGGGGSGGSGNSGSNQMSSAPNVKVNVVKQG